MTQNCYHASWMLNMFLFKLFCHSCLKTCLQLCNRGYRSCVMKADHTMVKLYRNGHMQHTQRGGMGMEGPLHGLLSHLNSLCWISSYGYTLGNVCMQFLPVISQVSQQDFTLLLQPPMHVAAHTEIYHATHRHVPQNVQHSFQKPLVKCERGTVIIAKWTNLVTSLSMLCFTLPCPDAILCYLAPFDSNVTLETKHQTPFVVFNISCILLYKESYYGKLEH